MSPLSQMWSISRHGAAAAAAERLVLTPLGVGVVVLRTPGRLGEIGPHRLEHLLDVGPRPATAAMSPMRHSSRRFLLGVLFVLRILDGPDDWWRRNRLFYRPFDRLRWGRRRLVRLRLFGWLFNRLRWWRGLFLNLFPRFYLVVRTLFVSSGEVMGRSYGSQNRCLT
jgi:hypothetical protein